MSALPSSDEYKIHISRVPTSFDETIVHRILVDHFQLDQDNADDVLQVELIFPRPDGNHDPTTAAKPLKQPSHHHDTTTMNHLDIGDDDGSSNKHVKPNNATRPEPTTHRGFGFLTLANKEHYDKIIACPTIKGGKNPTSTKLYTMHIRPYTTSPDETNHCYLWTQGRCPYGDNCKFEHKGPGACCVPVTKHTDDDDEEESKKRGKCFAFKKGKCLKGKNCPFSHQLQKPTIPVDNKDPKSSIPKSERDCLSWKSKGKCSKADNCPYRHDPKFLRKVEEKRKRKRQAQEGSTMDGTTPHPASGGDDSNHKKQKQKQPLCIRVFGMAYDTTLEDIQAFFHDCGKIQRMEFPTFEDSGRSKGYCGVWFTSPKAVEKAIELNGQELLGRWLSVQAGKMYLKEWEANHAHSAQDEQ